MIERNAGTSFTPEWIEDVNINYPAVVRTANELKTRRALKKEHQAAWLLKAATLIDLTTLAGDDTQCNVKRLDTIDNMIHTFKMYMLQRDLRHVTYLVLVIE